MNVNDIKTKIINGAYNDTFAMLYGETQKAAERYISALESFWEIFGERDNIRIFTAPGRTEVGGNHTDHQHGCVLAGSVNLDAIAIVSQTNTGNVQIKSEGYNMDKVDISDLSVNKSEKGFSSSLIRGVLAAFKNDGYNIGSFDAYTTSNVLKGSGLSSSAAFEVLVSNIVNGLFNNHAADCVSMAKYSQFAESKYFGKPCGLLDQMASSVGGFVYADFFDSQNPVIEKISFDIHKSGHTLCLIDTGGSHADLTDDYSAITVECKKLSRALDVEYLREADEQRFFSEMPRLRESCGDRAVLRGFHIFNENRRVLLQRSALKKSDFKQFLSLVNASGQSSYDYLQNLYSPSKISEQGLCVAIALAKSFLGDSGACRVHGGGFAGTVQCYVPNEKFSGFKSFMESVFGLGSCIEIFIRPVGGYEMKL